MDQSTTRELGSGTQPFQAAPSGEYGPGGLYTPEIYWREEAESRQQAIDQQHVHVECLMQDNDFLRYQREDLLKQVKELRTQLQRQHAQTLLSEHAKVEARRSGVPNEAKSTQESGDLWVMIMQQRQRIEKLQRDQEKSDTALQRELEDTIINAEGWEEDARACQIERDEMAELLKIQQEKGKYVGRSGPEVLDRIKALEAENNLLVETCTNLTENLALAEESSEGAAAEHAIAQEELDTMAKENEDLKARNGGLGVAKTELSQKISGLEDRVRLLEIVADYVRHIRSGLFHTGREGRRNRGFIEARNKAAHYGNIVVDIILFDLGFLGAGEKPFCEEKYAVSKDFSINTFIGNNETLKALSESVWARVLNAHAYIDSELKFGIKEELEGPLARFQALEVECLDRYEGWCRWATEEEALRIFSDGVIDLKVNEMERIVQLFRDVKRDRDARKK
jgi:hypothetical protein